MGIGATDSVICLRILNHFWDGFIFCFQPHMDSSKEPNACLKHRVMARQLLNARRCVEHAVKNNYSWH